MSASGIAPPVDVSPRAARAYAERVHQLVALVDGELAARPDLAALLGPNPFAVAHTNHENHGRFVATVLSFRSGELLAGMLPWVYGSYHAHGFSYHYFAVELDAWTRAVTATLPPEDAAEVLPLYRWMADRHALTVEAAETAPAGAQGEEEPAEEPARQFLFALVRGDHREATRVALARVAGPQDLAAFYLGTVQQCLWRVGHLWERGKITVAQEHLATAAVGNVMAALYGRLLSPAPTRGVAVVSAVSGEFHEVGARMVSDLLELDGWDVRYLGPNTPAEDVGAHCRTERAAVLALSVTMHFNLDAAAAVVEAVRRHSPGTRVLVGGRAFSGAGDLWRAVGADASAADATAAVDAARAWGKGA